jgi:hypothetical protein
MQSKFCLCDGIRPLQSCLVLEDAKKREKDTARNEYTELLKAELNKPHLKAEEDKDEKVAPVEEHAC